MYTVYFLCLKKSLKMCPFKKKIQTKIFIFKYFPKIPSEMNSTHPFYPILIPNTLYVKQTHYVRRGSQGVPKLKKRI